MAQPLKQGDTYRCPDDTCGCEIRVTKGVEKCSAPQPQAPTCCCGKSMVKTNG